jgi:PPOX class probable F420-dependent enzyme
MSRRDQIKMTEDEVHEFLAAPHTMNVATLNHDGTIHLVAMWYAELDGDPVFWTYGRSQKIRNLERDPRITCLVESGESYDQLRGVELVGRGELITERDEIMQVGFAVVDKHQGPLTEDMKPFVEQAGAKRLAVRVKVDKVVSWDHRKLEGAY